jgi:hypothetical protein
VCICVCVGGYSMCVYVCVYVCVFVCVCERKRREEIKKRERQKERDRTSHGCYLSKIGKC